MHISQLMGNMQYTCAFQNQEDGPSGFAKQKEFN